MRDAFAIAYAERLNLTRVTARRLQLDDTDRSLLVELVLGFEGTDVTLAVTDEDAIDPAPQVFAADEAVQEVDLTGVAPWSSAIGRPLLWIWEMTNQLGYLDGVQIEFARDVQSESVTLQLIALGAQLRVRAISPGFLP